MTLTILRSVGQLFCRMSLIWDWSGVFLTIRLGVWVCESTAVERWSSIFPTAYQRYMLSVWLTTLKAHLDHLAEVVVISFIFYFALYFHITLFFLLKLLHLWSLGTIYIGSNIPLTYLHHCVGWYFWFLLICLVLPYFLTLPDAQVASCRYWDQPFLQEALAPFIEEWY